MIVNVLPAQTYQRLRINASECDADTWNNISEQNTAAETLPSGVSYQTGVLRAEAEAIFGDLHARMVANDVQAVPPNGMTYDAEHTQNVRTGMGVEVDALYEEKGIRSTVYTIAENVEVSEPIVLVSEITDGVAQLRSQVIHAKAGAHVTVIMEYRASENASGFFGNSTKILAERGAQVQLVQVQRLSEKCEHFDDVGGIAEEDAAVEIVRLDLGAAKVWNGCCISLLGDRSRFENHTGFYCAEDSRYDMNYVAEHRGKKTESDMDFDGVLKKGAQKTFRGSLDFKKGSSGSVGAENEDVLLLDDDVINRSIPLILCQVEDVDGHHGATIGQIPEEILFYMSSRGLSEEAARQLVIRSRLLKVAARIPQDALREQLQKEIVEILQ